MGLDIRNEESVKVFFAVRNQYTTIGPANFPMAVSVTAVTEALKLFEVEEKERVFLRVTRAIDGHFIKKIQKEFKKK